MCWMCDAGEVEELRMIDVAQCPGCGGWFAEDAADGEHILAHIQAEHPERIAAVV